MLSTSYQSSTGIHLSAAVFSAFPAVLRQCYLFAAVAAHHEAAELAPGARSEEHEAEDAAAH